MTRHLPTPTRSTTAIGSDVASVVDSATGELSVNGLHARILVEWNGKEIEVAKGTIVQLSLTREVIEIGDGYDSSSSRFLDTKRLHIDMDRD